MLKLIPILTCTALLLASCERSVKISTTDDGKGNLTANISTDNKVSVTTNVNVSTEVVNNTTQTEVRLQKFRKSQSINGLKREIEGVGQIQIKDGSIVAFLPNTEFTITESKDNYTISLDLSDIAGVLEEQEFTDETGALAKRYKGNKETWKKAVLKGFEVSLSEELSAPKMPEVPEMPVIFDED